jgi:hypothetical protein
VDEDLLVGLQRAALLRAGAQRGERVVVVGRGDGGAGRLSLHRGVNVP